jgi:hypothetical protein
MTPAPSCALLSVSRGSVLGPSGVSASVLGVSASVLGEAVKDALGKVVTSNFREVAASAWFSSPPSLLAAFCKTNVTFQNYAVVTPFNREI